jgi:hypothetical protein
MSDDHLTKTHFLEYLKDWRAGWIGCAVVTFLLIGLATAELEGFTPVRTWMRAWRGIEPAVETVKPPQQNTADPLGIVGKWTYTTYFSNEEDAKKHKYKAVQGVNFLIGFDGCSYAMQGKRTHYEEKNSNTFQKYENPITIDISRTSFTGTKFYFYFQVKGKESIDQSEGYVELQIEKSNKSRMEGVVDYLHHDRTWSRAQIIFEKQQ